MNGPGPDRVVCEVDSHGGGLAVISRTHVDDNSPLFVAYAGPSVKFNERFKILGLFMRGPQGVALHKIATLN